ncbi:MAG: DUF202 domain-containing protein [Candidatus Hydrogenedentes bacterium]|nr:DUF202 domain-containing protein [Candidatus Hydrogenedentota bacterium]
MRTREHLANERTFLAWIRTALGLIGLGFVVARMGLFLRQMVLGLAPEAIAANQRGNDFVAAGVALLLFGTVLAGWSAESYHRTRLAIDSDGFEASRHAISWLALFVAAGGGFLVLMILWRALLAD